jgi:hypothetical protein
MEVFNLIQIATWISILICVVVFATLAIILRLVLYARIKGINKDKTPEVFKLIEEKYKSASEKSEYVNTIAIIDSEYQRQIIDFWKFKIQFDRAEAITKVVPNLLIAFGLIGTFIGITSNLANISNIITVDSNDPKVGELLKQLKLPLRDMGVAFSTSLFGLLFGSILTSVNTVWNTSIVKYQLISSLEDHLDNIFDKGSTRLDKAIEKMAIKQEDFLKHFHNNVGQVLQDTFGKAANQIADECGRINQIAENVYTNFSNAAGTISTGASTFQYAAKSLESQTATFAVSLHEFKSGVETFNIAANRLENNNIIQNLDRVLTELNTNQQAFANSTQILQDSLIGITTTNQTAAQLAQQVYETWQDSTTQILTASETIGAGAIIFQKAATSLEGQTQTVIGLMPELKNGVDTFASAANKVKTNNIVKHLNTLVETLSNTQAAFTNSTQILTTGLGATIANNQEATKLASQIYQGLGESTEGMQLGAKNLLDAAQIIQDSQLGIELNKASTEFTNSTEIFSRAANNLQPVAANLEPAIVSIDRAINSLQQVGSEVVSLSKNTAQASESTQTAITGFDRNYQQVLNNTESSIQDIGKTNRSNWDSLIDILEKKLQTDRSQNLQSIEAMKEHFIKMSLPDPESLARLLTILEKLENVLNTNQSNDSLASNENRKSGFFGISQRN